jgi:hypothetical protein
MDKDKGNRSLYDEALDRFRKDAAERHSGSKDIELLNEFLRERATPEETKQAAEVLQGDAGKKYGSRKVGDVEIPESWIANILGNIESFVAAGDFVTKNAPESVGMAWYAVKLTLTAIHSNYDLYTFFGSGLSDISEIMIIVRHYDRLYDERSKPQWKPSPLVEKLFQDVIGAYAAVLEFSFAIKRHLTAGAMTKIKHGFRDFVRRPPIPISKIIADIIGYLVWHLQGEIRGQAERGRRLQKKDPRGEPGRLPRQNTDPASKRVHCSGRH